MLPGTSGIKLVELGKDTEICDNTLGSCDEAVTRGLDRCPDSLGIVEVRF